MSFQGMIRAMFGLIGTSARIHVTMHEDGSQTQISDAPSPIFDRTSDHVAAASVFVVHIHTINRSFEICGKRLNRIFATHLSAATFGARVKLQAWEVRGSRQQGRSPSTDKLREAALGFDHRWAYTTAVGERQGRNVRKGTCGTCALRVVWPVGTRALLSLCSFCM